MATDFGLDVSTLEDLDDSGANVSGPRALAEAIIRKLMTESSTLLYADETECLDLPGYMSAGISEDELPELASQIESICEQDERVSSAQCILRMVQPATMNVTLLLTPNGGKPFTLVLSSNDVTVSLLEAPQ
jgi:hypothetical protein